MIPPRMLVRMFFDRRPHRGAREFKFRPAYRQTGGQDFVRVVARDGTMDAAVLLRPGSSDLYSFEQIFLGGAYNAARLPQQLDIASLYRRMQEPLILDLGANIGLASLYFRKSWPRAKIVAVEPDVSNFDMLCSNAPEVTPIRAAIASQKGRVKITNPDAAAWAYRTEVAGDGTIEAITVPDILERAPASQPFICKIDIEGAEQELFSKNTEWISAFPVVIVELHDWLVTGRGTARNFLRTVANLDRDFILVGENVWSVANSGISRDRRGAASFRLRAHVTELAPSD